MSAATRKWTKAQVLPNRWRKKVKEAREDAAEAIEKSALEQFHAAGQLGGKGSRIWNTLMSESKEHLGVLKPGFLAKMHHLDSGQKEMLAAAKEQLRTIGEPTK